MAFAVSERMISTMLKIEKSIDENKGEIIITNNQRENKYNESREIGPNMKKIMSNSGKYILPPKQCVTCKLLFEPKDETEMYCDECNKKRGKH